MSGHNKWSKIKHKKAAQDAKKSKVFGKLSRQIALEAKKAGGNLDSPGLKAVIDKARSENMPNDNIERAIKKAVEGGGGEDEMVLYEAYGPGGVAVLVETLTNNTNRTAGEVKRVFSKNGLSVAKPGSAAWLFEKKDNGYIPKTPVDVEKKDLSKLKTLVDGLLELDDVQEVYTNTEKL